MTEGGTKDILLRKLQQCIGSAAVVNGSFLDHPLVHALDKCALTPEQLKRFCQLRYSAASHFELTLKRARDLARAEGLGRKPIAEELQKNLDDEEGEGRAQGQGAHRQWRADFLQGLGVETVSSGKIILYAFSEQDSLATLLGILLAAEYTIPPEDKRALKSLRRAFPDTFTNDEDEGSQQQVRVTRYLADHIKHDAQQHLPDLMQAIEQSLKPEEIAEVLVGIDRFANERIEFYSTIQLSLGINLGSKVRFARE